MTAPALEPVDASLSIAILAPIGRDAILMSQVLAEAGMPNTICQSQDELCERVKHDIGAVLVTEEGLEGELMERLSFILRSQPAWSDMPFMILTGQPAISAKVRSFSRLGARANITLIDRPVRMKTLVATAEAVLQSRRRQYEIRDLMDALEERIQERDRFLAILGHELRNPLGAILLAVQMVDEEQGSLEKEHVGRIERQTRHLTRLVNDLLDLSRVTSGKIVLKRRVVDLEELVREVIDTLASPAENQQLTVSFHCDEKKILVNGDPTRLDQIVSNVLSNALKYTPAGGHIGIALECVGQEAVISIKDDGVGIAPERLSSIFELFAQAENAIGRAQGGMGIGLALVRNLVELHGGRVTAASDGQGRGSVFTIRLPLAEPAALASIGERTARKSSPTPREVTPRNIIVVEDNSDVRELLRLKLKRMGHEVEAAADGPSGLEAILSRKPDIAFVDIGLPGLDGYGVASKVREALGEDVFLVALSGFGQPDDKRKALEAGFNEHMTKPAEMSEIERVLSVSRPRS